MKKPWIFWGLAQLIIQTWIQNMVQSRWNAKKLCEGIQLAICQTSKCQEEVISWSEMEPGRLVGLGLLIPMYSSNLFESFSFQSQEIKQGFSLIAVSQRVESYVVFTDFPPFLKQIPPSPTPFTVVKIESQIIPIPWFLSFSLSCSCFLSPLAKFSAVVANLWKGQTKPAKNLRIAAIPEHEKATVSFVDKQKLQV